MTEDERELKDHRVVTMMSPSELEAIDDWMFKNRIRSRGEAIRRLCQVGIEFDQESTNFRLAIWDLLRFTTGTEAVVRREFGSDTLPPDMWRLWFAHSMVRFRVRVMRVASAFHAVGTLRKMREVEDIAHAISEARRLKAGQMKDWAEGEEDLKRLAGHKLPDRLTPTEADIDFNPPDDIRRLMKERGLL